MEAACYVQNPVASPVLTHRQAMAAVGGPVFMQHSVAAPVGAPPAPMVSPVLQHRPLQCLTPPPSAASTASSRTQASYASFVAAPPPQPQQPPRPATAMPQRPSPVQGARQVPAPQPLQQPHSYAGPPVAGPWADRQRNSATIPPGGRPLNNTIATIPTLVVPVEVVPSARRRRPEPPTWAGAQEKARCEVLEKVRDQIKVNHEKINSDIFGKAPSGSELDKTLQHGGQPAGAPGRRALAEVNGRTFTDDHSLKTVRYGEVEVEQKETQVQEENRRLKAENAKNKEELGKMQADITRLQALVASKEPKDQIRSLTSIMNSFDGPLDEPTRNSGRLSMGSEATLRDGDVKRTLQEQFNRQQEESLLRRQTEQNEQSLKERVALLETELATTKFQLVQQGDEAEKAAMEKRVLEASLAEAKFQARQTQVVEEEKKALQGKRDEAYYKLQEAAKTEEELRNRLADQEDLLRREQKNSTIWSAGDFRKTYSAIQQANAQELGVIEENDRLKSRVVELENELYDCKQELDTLRGRGAQQR